MGVSGQSGCQCDVCLALTRFRYTLTHPGRSAAYREVWVGKLQILAIQAQDAVVRDREDPCAPPQGCLTSFTPGLGGENGPPLKTGGFNSAEATLVGGEVPPPDHPATEDKTVIPVKEEEPSPTPKTGGREDTKEGSSSQKAEAVEPPASAPSASSRPPRVSEEAKKDKDKKKKSKKDRQRSKSQKHSKKDRSSSRASPAKSRKKRRSEHSCEEGESLEGERLRKEKAAPLKPPGREGRPVFRGNQPRTPSRSPPPHLRGPKKHQASVTSAAGIESRTKSQSRSFTRETPTGQALLPSARW